ncbi:hypothetical protein [Catellatospora sichuanensis]|uniref:hypothetical protein n=1 Tax=Catellatospora sichuanensis TaxID=1969805 RepID=UPI001184308E|nr:hypothetical protein [Catellatospora sichuanensis]
MLTRARVLAALATTTITVALTLVVTQSPAYADYIHCPPNNGPCVLIVEGGGSGGDNGDGGDGGNIPGVDCEHEDLGVIPCHDASMGYFNHTDSCYYTRMELAADDVLWGGNDPAGGFMYAVWCWGGQSAGWQQGSDEYLTDPPPGYGAMPSPMALAVRAIRLMPIAGPVINMAPDPDDAGLVGLPVWMWTPATASTWGSITREASVPGLTVSATATAMEIRWDMGDGTVVRCPSVGTPYTAAAGNTSSPDCGHRYTEPSRTEDGGEYHIVATTIWHVDWHVVGGGETGAIDIERFSTADVRIDEMQVVNSPAVS